MSTVKPEIAIASHKSPILFDVLLWNPASIITGEDSPDCFLSRWDFCFLSTGKTTGSSSPSNGTAKLRFFLRILKVFFYYVNLGLWNPSKPGTHDETHPNACSLQTFPMGWWSSKLKLGIFLWLQIVLMNKSQPFLENFNGEFERFKTLKFMRCWWFQTNPNSWVS